MAAPEVKALVANVERRLIEGAKIDNDEMRLLRSAIQYGGDNPSTWLETAAERPQLRGNSTLFANLAQSVITTTLHWLIRISLALFSSVLGLSAQSAMRRCLPASPMSMEAEPRRTANRMPRGKDYTNTSNASPIRTLSTRSSARFSTPSPRKNVHRWTAGDIWFTLRMSSGQGTVQTLMPSEARSSSNPLPGNAVTMTGKIEV